MSDPRLNRRLVLEAPDRVPDGAGGYRQTWVPLGEMWAEVKPGMGREKPAGFAVISSVHYRIYVRGAPVGAPSRPRAEQRFRDGGRLYRIHAVTEHDPAARFLVCYAYEEGAA
jgi:head-tail adaptor